MHCLVKLCSLHFSSPLPSVLDQHLCSSTFLLCVCLQILISFDSCCRDDSVTKAAIGVMGDLADTLGPSAAPLFNQAVFYKDFVDECTSSDDQQLKETAEWALSTVNRITNTG